MIASQLTVYFPLQFNLADNHFIQTINRDISPKNFTLVCVQIIGIKWRWRVADLSIVLSQHVIVKSMQLWSAVSYVDNLSVLPRARHWHVYFSDGASKIP